MSFISLLLKPKIVIVTSPRSEAPALACHFTEAHVPLSHLAKFAELAPPPAAYVGWLMGTDYDAYDLANALIKAGFQGRCILISPTRLPSHSLIVRELSAAFPQITFSLWLADEAPALAEAFCEAQTGPHRANSAPIDA